MPSSSPKLTTVGVILEMPHAVPAQMFPWASITRLRMQLLASRPSGMPVPVGDGHGHTVESHAVGTQGIPVDVLHDAAPHMVGHGAQGGHRGRWHVNIDATPQLVDHPRDAHHRGTSAVVGVVAEGTCRCRVIVVLSALVVREGVHAAFPLDEEALPLFKSLVVFHSCYAGRQAVMQLCVVMVVAMAVRMVMTTLMMRRQRSLFLSFIVLMVLRLVLVCLVPVSPPLVPAGQ